jgi:hypothetical protein
MNFEFSSQTIDSTLATVGWNTTKVGAGTTIFGFLTSSQGAALIGVCGVIGGLLIQWYYRRRQDRREQAEHERRMGLME